MGVSCFGEADQGWNDAIKRADRALYQAKTVRNTIRVFREHGQTAVN